jgi:type II secretory pathway component PulF
MWIFFQRDKYWEEFKIKRWSFVTSISVLVLVWLVLTLMLVIMVPEVEQLYSAFGADTLPFMTSVLVTLSNFVRNFFGFIVYSVVSLVIIASIAILPQRLVSDSMTGKEKKIFMFLSQSIVLIVLGFVIGLLAMGVYLPIYSIGQNMV